ncbi:hypothetical protein GHT06_012955 [Daphnia sinensis]|uniref:LNS2/PITP domain-containing protein n=1 Tax=Daphnia sinensis TaxID=1820382 RepID=A0AAD5PWL8_9CRUS|nr:hypothetical protein GHT06_012955 [Daphnia sinensis]
MKANRLWSSYLQLSSVQTLTVGKICSFADVHNAGVMSDVLGYILPIISLFTMIKNNGYRILYLSARAIGQAHVTRKYLRLVKQGDLSLPDGPLLLNPTSLLSAFHREDIENLQSSRFGACMIFKCYFRRIHTTLDTAIESMYSKQSLIIDFVFPPFLQSAREVLEGSEFSEFTYWRQLVPDTLDETKISRQVYHRLL